MKNLLKNLTLILSVSLIISCSGDDENTVDPIIGIWKYSTQFENSTQTTVNDCSPSTIEFTSAGNRTNLYYGKNNSGNCVVVDNVNMTWKKLSANSYQFTQNGFPFTETVIFENGNNTLTLEDSDTNGNGNIVVYRFVYTRIN
ncbi:MAG: hypothetical protein Q7U08_06965 [Flavobacteriaceae bacterium]|nr:hypothetical protein [Flavobacteriaceae bacterium]